MIDRVLNLCDKDKLIGHKEAECCDQRYTALLNYAKQYLADNSEIKVRLCTHDRQRNIDLALMFKIKGKVLQFSQDITRILRSTIKRSNGKDICPEQSVIAAPIFQVHKIFQYFFVFSQRTRRKSTWRRKVLFSARELDCTDSVFSRINFRLNGSFRIRCDDSPLVLRTERHEAQSNDTLHGANLGGDRLDYLVESRECARRASGVQVHSWLHREDT